MKQPVVGTFKRLRGVFQRERPAATSACCAFSFSFDLVLVRVEIPE